MWAARDDAWSTNGTRPLREGRNMGTRPLRRQHSHVSVKVRQSRVSKEDHKKERMVHLLAAVMRTSADVLMMT